MLLLTRNLAYLTGLLLTGVSHGALTVYVSPNDIESAEDSGIVNPSSGVAFTEDFNSLPLGSIDGYVSPTTGVTYNAASSGNVQANDQYGGDNEGNYLGIAANTSTTLTLANPAEYFGFYFTAGDANNRIQILSGGVVILDFSTQTLIDLLPRGAGNTVTALDGNNYFTDDYYGQPVTGNNGNEPYAYLHFAGTGGTTFDEIILSQTVSAIFENDNHSILDVGPSIPLSFVAVQSVPELGTSWLSIIAFAGFLGIRRRGA